jgi:hypothetical protein
VIDEKLVATGDTRVLAVYSRVSTDKQEKGLEAQQRALAEYIAYQKAEGVLHFSDELSGMKRSRPGFDKLMAAVRAGEVHTVLVYSFSRFARSDATADREPGGVQSTEGLVREHLRENRHLRSDGKVPVHDIWSACGVRARKHSFQGQERIEECASQGDGSRPAT